VAAGSYTLTAKATDNSGASTASGAVSISVNAAQLHGVFYIHADHLNTPRMISDSTKKVVWSWNSDPFGATAPNEDVDGDGVGFVYNARFPGQYFDSETGLYYNWHRYYDPFSGRYTTADPILLLDIRNKLLASLMEKRSWEQPAPYFKAINPALLQAAMHVLESPENLHLYAYVTNNPIRYFDEEGQYKGTPSDPPGFVKCALALLENAMNIEKYNKECQKECAAGEHGGSMQRCAVKKTWSKYEPCIKFAAPGG